MDFRAIAEQHENTVQSVLKCITNPQVSFVHQVNNLLLKLNLYV